MVPLFNTLSRSDADVIASLLHAHDINFHIGGYCHNSVIMLPIALGGYDFTIAEDDFDRACEVIRSIEDIEKPYFSKSLQKCIINRIVWAALFLFIWVTIFTILEKEKYIGYLLLPYIAIESCLNTQASRVFHFPLKQ